MHPKLEAIHYLDFSTAAHQPWSILIEQIGKIEQDSELPEYDQTLQVSEGGGGDLPEEIDPIVESILTYLNQRGLQMVSISRLRTRKIIDEKFSDKDLQGLIQKYRMILRPARLKGGKRGVAKL